MQLKTQNPSRNDFGMYVNIDVRQRRDLFRTV